MTPTDALVDAIAEAVVRRMAAIAPATQIDQRLINVKTAAKYLCRTEASVRGMIISGEIPSRVVRRFSGRVFLEKRQLDAWVDAQ